MTDDIELPSERELYEKSRDVLDGARERGLTVGMAESCTGGLVVGSLTAVPGSSAVVKGGVVSYALSVKSHVLGVESEVLDDPAVGAVSDICAREMCIGAQRVLDADVTVSVTGIAGPGGAEPGKPVGTVWFGLKAGDAPAVAEVMHFSGERDAVRRKAVMKALWLLGRGVGSAR